MKLYAVCDEADLEVTDYDYLNFTKANGIWEKGDIIYYLGECYGRRNFYARIIGRSPTSISLEELDMNKENGVVKFYTTDNIITDGLGRRNLTNRSAYLLHKCSAKVLEN